MDPVEMLKEKVREFLPQIVKGYEVRGESLVVRQGTVAVFLEFYPMGEEHSILRLVSPVLSKVPDSDPLYRKMSELNASLHFGRVYKDKDIVFLDHCLLGNYLDLAELGTGLSALAFTADDLDEKLKDEFGGKRFSDA